MNSILRSACYFGMVVMSLPIWAQEMPPAEVDIHTVGKHLLSPKMELKGNVISLQDATIAAEVDGRLLAIAQVGTAVTVGSSLATIDTEILSLNKVRAEALLASLQADLTFKTSEVERFSSLANSENAAKNELQRANAEKEMLLQQIVAAKADIKHVEKLIRDSQFLAPFDGVVTHRFAQKGEYLSVGTAVLRLVDTDTIEVVVPTPLAHYRLISMGDLLQVIRGTEQFTLPVSSVVAVGDPQTRMVEVRLDASESPLVVGESVSVYAPRALAEERVAVPRDAIIIRGSQRFVYKVDNGTAVQVEVQEDFADGELVAVIGNISEGDSVIVRGAERLQNGMPVSVR